MSNGTGPEQLRDFLARRERELTQQISALRGQIVPKEQELAEVHKAMAVLGIYSAPLNALVSGNALLAGLAPCPNSLENALGAQLAALPRTNSPSNESPIAAALAPPNGLATILGGLGNPPAPPTTIKRMIDSALRDHFRDGATPAELRDYFKAVYGRDVERSSISPQLARLRADGRIAPTEDGKWALTRGGRLFDHPTSWNPTDEPPEGSE